MAAAVTRLVTEIRRLSCGLVALNKVPLGVSFKGWEAWLGAILRFAPPGWWQEGACFSGICRGGRGAAIGVWGGERGGRGGVGLPGPEEHF